MAKSRNVGSANPNAKLNEVFVRNIRHGFDSGTAGAKLAEVYGVTYRCIMYVVRKRTWKHVVP